MHFGHIVSTAARTLYIEPQVCYNISEHSRGEEYLMKKAALIMALLAVLTMLTLAGCKNESMLDNFSSDTYELGEEDPITWDDIF